MSLTVFRRALFNIAAVHPLIAATHGPYWVPDCCADAARTVLLKDRIRRNAERLAELTEQAEAVVSGQ